MKRSIHLFLLLCFAGSIHSQSNPADSLRLKLRDAPTDSLKLVYYRALFDAYEESRPDSALVFALEGLKLATEIGAEKRRSQFLTRIANLVQSKLNYPHAYEFHTASLIISEEIDDPVGIGASFNNLGEFYKVQEDFGKALEHYAKAEGVFSNIILDLESGKDRPVSEKTASDIKMYKKFRGIVLMNLGHMYELLNKLDSALYHEQRALASATANEDLDLLGAIYTNLGSIYSSMSKPELALETLRKGIPYLEAEDDKRFMTLTYITMSDIYEKASDIDSALIFAHRSLVAASDGTFHQEELTAAEALSRLFEKKQQGDSALHYQKLVASIKGTMLAQDNIRKVDALSFEEKIHQEEIAQAKAKAARERSDMLQYFIITIVLVVVFIALSLLSKRKAKPKFIEYMGMIGLLLLFEFISLFIHPYIAKWTHHKPIFMLLILAGIGAILTPMHHLLIRWIKKKMAHKNAELPESEPVLQKAITTQANKT